MTAFTKPLNRAIGDQTADQVRRSHAAAIGELQDRPAVGAVPITGIELPDGKDVFVAHRLGRAPSVVLVSPPYPNILAVGAIHEVRGVSGTQQIDRSKFVVLKADGFGMTVSVDVLVVP